MPATEPASATIRFYRAADTYGFLSNFSAHPFHLAGKRWPTVEHYFQTMKFAGTPHEEAIRLERSPMLAALRGRQRSLPLRHDWEQVKVEVMRAALLAKFSQNKQARQALLATGDAMLVEHTWHDSFWGDAGDGTGRNTLGRLLMAVRDLLRPR